MERIFKKKVKKVLMFVIRENIHAKKIRLFFALCWVMMLF